MDQLEQQEFIPRTSEAPSGGRFSVVRFFSDASVGLVQEVVDDDLSLEAAKALARTESEKAVPGEDIIVLDQEKIGLEAEVEAYRG